ncbi:hypothetical protein SAMN05421759_107118 [Roseivivax lentus]|uniref:Curlin associated repeat-containing protein n=1 Tax=Roseivivax lentus TaxID=633194 RepID=A0A1N7NAA9_9RHOB|nr:hypothetical protein [Roseivivax lentus]SIS95168.1 hypothetical protein SAMN05421759_107118 [Roseivivax lentus]
MKTLTISALAIAFAGSAYAQDAYVNQLGDNLTGMNYAEYSTGNDATQVIVQQGVGYSAGQLSRGAGNSATTYQIDSTNTFINSLPNEGSTAGGPAAESLIWQSGDGFQNGYNTAVAVQLNQQGPGSQNSTFLSQIIQEGNDNTAVNWTQNQGNTNGMAGVSLLLPTTLSANVTPGTTPLPTPVVNVNFPYGSSITN